MSVSFSGLDLSFLNDPVNRLPPQAARNRRPNFAAKRSSLASPTLMQDIAPFVANATSDSVEITSRSQLRAYERDNGLKQCGDYKSGEIIATQNKRVHDATSVSAADKKSADFKWTD